MKKIILFMMVVGISCKAIVAAQADVSDVSDISQVSKVSQADKPSAEMIEPGLYILVSFSMNDKSLRRYFIEAENLGGRLVINGLLGDSSSGNRFEATKERIERAKINVDINPVIFEQFGVEHVPMIIAVYQDGKVKKVSGHISLNHALDTMDARDIIADLNSAKDENLERSS